MSSESQPAGLDAFDFDLLHQHYVSFMGEREKATGQKFPVRSRQELEAELRTAIYTVEEVTQLDDKWVKGYSALISDEAALEQAPALEGIENWRSLYHNYLVYVTRINDDYDSSLPLDPLSPALFAETMQQSDPERRAAHVRRFTTDFDQLAAEDIEEIRAVREKYSVAGM